MATKDVMDYKCPCCGGSLSFDAQAQKVTCPYCDNQFEVDLLRELDEADAQTDDAVWEDGGSAWTDEEKEHLAVFSCNSCGGEIVCEDTTASAFCPYCSNPVIFKGRLSGGLKPDFIIPFKTESDVVNDSFAKLIKGKLLLPSAFRRECKTTEVKGLYVPYWIYDADVTGTVYYHATDVRHWSDSNYNYTETKHYSVVRGGDIAFEHIPVDGSKKMADDMMESIEPFDFSEAVTFTPAYISGFYSDKYDVPQEETFPRANQRIKQGTENAFTTTVRHYSTLRVEKSNIKLNSSKVSYTLYPVWTLVKKWKDKSFLYVVNGQTGKIAGELPKDGLKLTLWAVCSFLLSALLAGLIATSAECEMGEVVLAGILFGGIVCGITVALLLKQMKTVAFRNGAAFYYKDGSMNVYKKRDTFLYRNVTKTRRQNQSSNNKR